MQTSEENGDMLTYIPVRAITPEILGVVDGDEDHASSIQLQALPHFLQLALVYDTILSDGFPNKFP